MFVATFIIIIEAIQRIIDLTGSLPVCTFTNITNATVSATLLPKNSTTEVQVGYLSSLRLDALTLSIIGGTIVIKFFMWLYCIAYRKKSSSVRALATDRITDVVANLFLLGCYVFAYFIWPYMDPLGGILISFYLMYNWYGEGKIEVKKLSGQSAPPEFLRKITYVVWNHSPMIVAVDTVRAFYFANGFTVDVDIVLPFDMLLRYAHDIGESVQHRLEAIDGERIVFISNSCFYSLRSEVDRAYVHLDHESDHGPGTEHPAQHYECDGQRNISEQDGLLSSNLDEQFDGTTLQLSSKRTK